MARMPAACMCGSVPLAAPPLTSRLMLDRPLMEMICGAVGEVAQVRAARGRPAARGPRHALLPQLALVLLCAALPTPAPRTKTTTALLLRS